MYSFPELFPVSFPPPQARKHLFPLSNLRILSRGRGEVRPHHLPQSRYSRS